MLLESLDQGSAFVGSREGWKVKDLLERGPRSMTLIIGVLVGFKRASSTYIAVVIASRAGLCKVTWLQSLGRNRGGFREFTSVKLSKAGADGHRVVVISTS